jgi:hypothetical protein
MNQTTCPQEYDFALVIDGVSDLTPEIEDALFEAGCNDATFSIRYGHLFAEFSRTSMSVEEAIFSAIEDVRKTGIKVSVVCVDQCNLVTQSDIARRIKRSRQLVSQYISGERGPGNFPPPECHLGDNAPLWGWCDVSHWLAENNIIRREESWNAEVVAGINNVLEMARQIERNPDLVRVIAERMKSPCGNCP